MFGVFANQWGYNGHSTHFGGASILGPDGETLAKSARLQDGIIKARLDPRALYEARNERNHILKQRRPEMYGEVTRMI